MEKEDYATHAPTLHHYQLIANPTEHSWSQAYIAGSLFVLLSLQAKNQEEPLEMPIGSIGKKIINTFEQEYFTLENKNLVSIKTALQTTIDTIPSELEAQVLVSVIPTSPSKPVAYVFIYQKGTILLKRRDQVGTILSVGSESENPLLSSSGYLEDEDVLILATQSFLKTIPPKQLTSLLLHATTGEAAEQLAPTIHQHEEGDVAALFVAYQSKKSEDMFLPEKRENSEEPSIQKKRRLSITPLIALLKPLASLRLPKSLPSSRKTRLIFVVAVILFFILAVSIYSQIKTRQEEQAQETFEKIYAQVTDSYEQGQSIATLNRNLANDYFQKAEQIIQNNRKLFKKNSPQDKEMEQLLQKIKTAQKGPSSSVTPQKISTEPALFTYKKSNPSSLIAQDESEMYAVSQNSLVKIDPSSAQGKEVVKNSSYWTSFKGFGAYSGNFYILDTQANMLVKLVPAGDTYSKTNYFPSGQQVSNGVSLGIDGSIWILLQNGTIEKYTSGQKEGFTISNLPSPLRSPTLIATAPDFTFVYVLDNGASQLVVFDKNGMYQKSYTHETLNKATLINVLEKDKKVQYLSGSDVFEFPL